MVSPTKTQHMRGVQGQAVYSASTSGLQLSTKYFLNVINCLVKEQKMNAHVRFAGTIKLFLPDFFFLFGPFRV